MCSLELRKKMVYYAMPLIMKTETGATTQHQLCLNSNQMVVSDNYNAQLPAPQQPQLINLSTGDASPQQNNYTYQLLTSSDHQQVQQQQQNVLPQQISVTARTPKLTKSFKCDQCNMTFTTKSAHTSHIKSHAKQQAAANSQSQTNGSNTSANQQMQSSDPYQCDVCKKTFAVPARLVSGNIFFEELKFSVDVNFEIRNIKFREPLKKFGCKIFSIFFQFFEIFCFKFASFLGNFLAKTF